ncbi:Cytochrome P450 [Dillenia turbinata]|uniref:Cytochrome P450 n=1 Tax=Dillenia turbinata TaxID=194707 RepID=A0AAN8Z899_9MAGN
MVFERPVNYCGVLELTKFYLFVQVNLPKDVFSAGTDTTYAVMEWTMTELLRHPQVMKNLQDEVQGIVQGKCYVSEDDLERMSYLKAVIKETLRLYPPIPLLVPRLSRKDVKSYL